MSGFFIPPKEISFRLKNKKTEKVLFSREKSPGFGHFSGDTFADQWWCLVPGDGDYKGQYLVKSKFTENVLFSRTAKSPRVDHHDGNGKWADQWFKLVLVVSVDGVTNAKADAATDDSQYWSFEFEDMEFVGLDYDINQQKVLSSTPAVVGKQYFISRRIATFGWPSVVEGKVEISVAQTKDFKWGKQDSEIKTATLEIPATAKPFSKVTAIATATKSDIELPFTITWKSKKTGYEVKSKGVYKGTSYWNTITNLKQSQDGENRELDPFDGSEGWEEAEVISRTETTATNEERSLDDEKTEGERKGFVRNAQEDEYEHEHAAYGAEGRYAQEEPEPEGYEQETEEQDTWAYDKKRSQYEEDRDGETRVERYGEDDDTTRNNGYGQDDKYNGEPGQEKNDANEHEDFTYNGRSFDNERSSYNEQPYKERSSYNEQSSYNDQGSYNDQDSYNDQSLYNEKAAEESEGAEPGENAYEDARYQETQKYKVSWAEERNLNGYRERQDDQENGTDTYGETRASQEYGRFDEDGRREFEHPTREDGYPETNSRSNWC
ncbi:unnamed protein product [Alternaria sp. RS040]